jgi:hypothetical protein
VADETDEQRSQRELNEAQEKFLRNQKLQNEAVERRAEKERLQASGEWPKNDPVP